MNDRSLFVNDDVADTDEDGSRAHGDDDSETGSSSSLSVSGGGEPGNSSRVQAELTSPDQAVRKVGVTTVRAAVPKTSPISITHGMVFELFTVAHARINQF